MANTLNRVVVLAVCVLFIQNVQSSKHAESSTKSKEPGSWNYKFAFTTNMNSQLSIDCSNDDQIWIGWSHYGTRSNQQASETGANSKNKFNVSPLSEGILSASIKNSQAFNFPNENDCWMNFTEKIAEQCNGSPNCEISSQPTYIHKCNKISDYIYVAYKCIKAVDTFDICKTETRIYSQEFLQKQSQSGFYIKSPDFPVEYPSSVDCSCSITTNTQHPLKLEVLWFSLQDNDYIQAFNKNLTGWINPTYEIPILTKSTSIRFTTDDALAYKGFWLKIGARRTCRDDWQLVGDSCVKIFSETVDWRTANQRCQQMNGYLVKIDDVVSDLKLTQYMKSFHSEINSYWIGMRKYVDEHNQERWMWTSNGTSTYEDVSWWPWRKSHVASTTPSSTGSTGHHHSSPNHCVIKRKNEDGFFATSCESSNRNNFICQTETVYSASQKDLLNAQVKLQCGSTEEIKKAEIAMNSIEFPAPADIGSTSIKLVEKKLSQDLLKSAGIFGSLETLSSSQLPSEEDSKSTEETTTRATTKSVRKTNGLNRASFSRPFSSSSSMPSSASSTLFDNLQATKQYQVSSSNGAIALIKNVGSAHSASSSNNSGSTKLNTTVLAGMITGVGFVVILINLGVLFICRRNLKSFIKNTKDTRNPREDMIQEYFDAFNTLHNLNAGAKTLRVGGSAALNGVTGMAGLPAHTLHSLQHSLIKENLLTLQQQQQLRSNSNSSGEELLLHDAAAQLFFSPQQAQQTFARDTNVRQSVSAFKPFMKELHHQQQQLLLINSSSALQQNQYDKMNHQKLVSANEENNSSGQYAHTYESLDTLEVPNRRTLVHLGINGRNYRTVNDVLIQGQQQQQLSPSLNIENTTNITEVGNLSSTSTSSSSGSSSTHPFIRSSNNNNSNSTCNLNGHLIDGHSQQLLIPQTTALPAQIITLNDLKQFNHLILQHNPQQQQHLILDGQNTLNLNLNLKSHQHHQHGQSGAMSNESWSPDSAYYSSIPTLGASYTPNFAPPQPQQQQQQINSNFKSQQPFVNSTFMSNQENFKSHLV